MRVDGKSMRSIWLEGDGWSVGIIDQTALPHRLTTARLTGLEDAAHAIAAMLVRGAPLIGATAAYGVCLALRADASDEALDRACATLLRTRPTAINLNGHSTKWSPRCGTAPRRARCRGLPARPRNLRAGHRHQHGNRKKRIAADRSGRQAQEARPAGQCAHPLQCRMAGCRRCRYRHRADLSGAR